MITYNAVVNKIVELFHKAETELPDDVVRAIEKALEREENEMAQRQLEAILRNIEVAKTKKIPICQDTGIPIIFLEIGMDVTLDFDLKSAIEEGVKKATELIPLRPNAVHPLTRENPGTNIGVGIPDIHCEFVEGDHIQITVAPKGAGSENMSRLRMFNPSEAGEIKKFVVETVKNAMGKPCPPTIVGVGIGGSFDKCARLAKKAAFKVLGTPSEYEAELLEAINSLGIGPMGLGGRTTSLAVNVEMAYCHTASLPVAVNIQCWASRRASGVLR
jgi:fumarate hydratase subunit alpha